jgi:hypothetical protein
MKCGGCAAGEFCDRFVCIWHCDRSKFSVLAKHQTNCIH